MQVGKPTRRRQFLKMAALGAAGTALLAACSQAAPPASPTSAPASAPTSPPPTAAPAAAAAAAPTATTAAAAPTATAAAAAPTATPAAAAAPTAAPTTAPAAGAPANVPNVPRNQTLIMAGLGGEDVGGFTDVDNFNHYSPGLSRSGLYQAATEPLFYYNMLGDEFIPWIGESYQYNSDYTQITVKIRQGVTWSDGQPYTAKDPAFTLNMLRDPKNADLNGDIARLVKDAQAVDDQTLQVSFNGPQPRFHWNYFTYRADVGLPIVPEHVWNGQDPHTFKNYDPSKGWPLGTGPYKLVSSDVQQKIWDVRPDWWAAKIGFQKLPQVTRLIFLPGMNEITMAQMLIQNQIDMAFSLTASNLQLVQGQNPKITTHYDKPPFGYMDWWPIGLGFNTTVQPFDDPEIRWAISQVIDRNELVQFAFSGYNQAATLPFPPYPGLQPYQDSIKDLTDKYLTNEYNPQKSAATMQKKGYKMGSDGLWVDANGKKVSFQIVTFPQHPSATPCAPIVTEQLKKGGFDASFLLPADFVTRITTGAATAFLWGHGGAMKDPYDTLNLYNIRYVLPTGKPIYFTNIYRWSNKAFSEIVDQMSNLPIADPAVTGLYHKAMEQWLPNLPDIQLVQTVINVPMNTTYWTNWPQGDKPYIHEGFWHRTALLMFLNLKPASG
jgi:peptide/nickel transport system substrate-binding protein